AAKAFLATEQRIPGLGNGVLQDILLEANLHPKRKMNTLTDAEIQNLYHIVVSVLADMTKAGGRDTEKDLFGMHGGYRTKLSRNTLGGYCPNCGGPIQKMAYMGGAVYICENCQPFIK
ncbi:MAG TPA: endonuclease VIII, partial [Lachnospiraceae bacterium]|nr:endonuclease VIII [Lachnospiraceae bacterium]